jgi:acyl carrier protein
MDQGKSTIIAKMREILVAVAEYKGRPADLPDVGIVDKIGLDSIIAIEYLINVEAEFGIEIADEDLGIDLVDSFERLADYVVDRLAAA